MNGDRVHPTELVRLLNCKLAATRSVIVKTPDKLKAQALRAYQLRDTVSGEIRYLSVKDLKTLARNIGLFSK